MTNLVSIHTDVLIDILDQLEVPDLLHFFTTNKELKEKYQSHFQEKIEDYQEDLRHRKEVAIPKQQANFDQFARKIDLYLGYVLIGIPNNIASFMGIGHMPKYRRYTLYTDQLLNFWWTGYF